MTSPYRSRLMARTKVSYDYNFKLLDAFWKANVKDTRTGEPYIFNPGHTRATMAHCKENPRFFKLLRREKYLYALSIVIHSSCTDEHVKKWIRNKKRIING